MSVFDLLPSVLWPIVGDFIFMDVTETEDSIELTIKQVSCYAIVYTEEGPFVEPCLIS
jgi:hypothetical protein